MQSGRQEQSRHSGELTLFPRPTALLHGQRGAETRFSCRSCLLFARFSFLTTRAKDKSVREGHLIFPTALTAPDQNKTPKAEMASGPFAALRCMHDSTAIGENSGKHGQMTPPGLPPPPRLQWGQPGGRPGKCPVLARWPPGPCPSVYLRPALIKPHGICPSNRRRPPGRSHGGQGTTFYVCNSSQQQH